MKKSFVFLCSVALLTVGVTTASAVPVHAAGNDTEITDTTDSLAVSNKTGYIYFRHGEGVLSAYKDPELKIFGPEVIHFAERYMTNQAVAAYDQIATNTKTNQVVAYHIPDGWVGLDSWTAEDPNQYTAGTDWGVLTVGKKAQQLYTDPKLTTPANRTLAAGTRWRYTASETIHYKYTDVATDYAYQVGTNLWLPVTAVSNANSYQRGVLITDRGVVEITNRSGAVMYDSLMSSTAKPSSRKLAYGSKWQYPGVYVSRGGTVLGYQVATGLFVKAADAKIVQQRGVFTVNAQGETKVIDGNGNATNRVLPNGSRWRTVGVRYGAETMLYQIAPNLYVNARAGSWIPTK